MKKNIVKIVGILALVFSLQLIANTASAQCPMCKMGAESNLKMGGTAGKGLNNGIMYMFAMPYLVVASVGLFWYYNRKKEDEEEIVGN